MNFDNLHRRELLSRLTGKNLRKSVLFLFLFFLLMGFITGEAQAQFVFKWIAIGDLQNKYTSGGASPEYEPAGMLYPGLYDRTGHLYSQGVWIATTSWDSKDTESPAKVYPIKVVHRGPRDAGYGQFFPIQHKVISKFKLPVVTVDGLETFDEPMTVEEVRPDMKPDMMIHNIVNTAIGVTIDRKIMAFSNEYHDNYHIIDYTFTNTGNVDADEEIELPDQSLTGVYIAWLNRWESTYKAAGLPVGVAWGRNAMNDVVGDGNKTYDRDFRAVYLWGGHLPSHGDWNTIGAPQINNSGWYTAQADTIGRLAGSSFFGRVTLHADGGPGDTADDPNQPSTTNILDSDDPLTSRNDPFDEGTMAQEYDLISAGHLFPFHADRVTPPDPPYDHLLDPLEWRTRFAGQKSRPDYMSAGGFQNITSYGPYELAPGESVHLVAAEAADGISWDKNYIVGNAYKRAVSQYGHPAADSATVKIGDTRLTKNEWVMTGRDSLMNAFETAIANYESNYDIPEPPKPPEVFNVNSRADRVEITWETFTGEPDPQNWVIYRSKSSIDSTFSLIATLPGSDRLYEDDTAVRGIDYYYYLQAVGGEVTDNTVYNPHTGTMGMQYTLRSNRYYTQTYAPASLKRSPGAMLSDVRVVPNPFNLASEENIRWPDQQDKLGFMNVPGECTIKIYTESGELIQTIDHNDGSGDEYWQLNTVSNQVVVSGIYFAVIKDTQTGDQIIRHFIIIR